MPASSHTLSRVFAEALGPDSFTTDWQKYYMDMGEFHGPLRIEAAQTDQEKNDELVRLAGNFILAAHDRSVDDLTGALHIWNETKESIMLLQQSDENLYEKVKNLTSWSNSSADINDFYDKGRRGFINLKGHPSEFGNLYRKSE